MEYMSTLVENPRAGFDHEFMEKFEAGLKLVGPEVKTLRKKQGSLAGAHVTVRGSEVYLVNAFIPPYQPENTGFFYDPHRPRKLLLTRREIKELVGKEATKGLTLIPISLYTKGRHIKLQFALARAKKKFDKRETIKKRDTDRDIAREMRVK